MTTKLKETLLQESGLLSLSQSDCDLFLIAQANAITYRQLAITGLHGSSITSGRFSIKRLEKEGYVISRFLPGNAKEKYYILTAKGRKRIEKLFDDRFLKKMFFQLEKRPPTSQQQLPHRIHTNDLYFSYLSCPYLDKLPTWQLEVPYPASTPKQQMPRCDGFLNTGYKNYYIEQDNCTQGDAAIENKLTQYMNSKAFTGKNLRENILVFTLHTDAKAPPVKKPPYSLYRILLKAIRIWRMLEQEIGHSLCFTEFCSKADDNVGLCQCLLSPSERNILRNLCHQHPNISLDEALLMKRDFLYDTSLLEEHIAVKDAYFTKRLQQRFYKILEMRSYATLQYRLRSGMSFYILPNHNLTDNLPFLLQREYRLDQWFPQILYHMGLVNLEAWQYHHSITIAKDDTITFTFYNTYTFGTAMQSIIIFEDIVHDLGGRERVRFFLRNNNTSATILFILLVSNREDAALFMTEAEKMKRQQKNSNIFICFFNKSKELYHNPKNGCAYYKESINTNNLWLPAMVEHDDFTGELHLMEGGIPFEPTYTKIYK